MTGLLLSGGIDSIALAYWFRPAIAFTVDYGQLPAKAEVRASAAVAEALNIQHEVITANLSSLGSGDLAGRKSLEIAPAREWWPYRNQMLVTLVAMRALSFGVEELLIGTVSSDAFHADGSTPFIEALSELLQLQEGDMRLSAPAAGMSTVELVRSCKVPQSILGWSHSCHMSEYACGVCRGCCKHYNVTQELGWDPH